MKIEFTGKLVTNWSEGKAITTGGMVEAGRVTITAEGKEANDLLEKVFAKEVPSAAPAALEPVRWGEALRDVAAMFRCSSIRVGHEHIGVRCVSSYENERLLSNLADFLDEIANGNQKIRAIKILRDVTGLSLRDSKEAVESLSQFRPDPAP